MSNAEPIEHSTDGRESWKLEAKGLVRKRAILTVATMFLLFAVAPGPNWHIPAKPIYLAALLIFMFGLYYLRVRTLRSLEMKHQLHMITHTIRDGYIGMNSANESVDINGISRELCQIIREYFSVLTNSSGIGVAIRSAIRIRGDTYYSTVGRAGLSRNRSNTTEDLHQDSGLAKLCRSSGRGVFLVSDLNRAQEAGLFLSDTNTEQYPNDFSTMMVCPINGWDGVGKGMLGILYITSKRDGLLGAKYTDSMGFIADALANIYSELIMTRVNVVDGKDIVTLSNDESYEIPGDGNEPIRIV